MTIIEVVLVWYVTEVALKNQYEMDEVGMIECCNFFGVVLSAGLTILIYSVGKHFHQSLEKYTGLPLDFNDKYLVHTRYGQTFFQTNQGFLMWHIHKGSAFLVLKT